MKDLENDKIVEKNNSIYNSAVEKHGVSSSAVLWDDQQTQYLRFFELTKNIDLNDAHKTLLDVGCGNGELLKFLNFIGYRGQYFGLDINEALINQAKERFGKDNFFLQDIMADGFNRKFDYVILSGLFNTNVGQKADWTQAFLVKMFELSKSFISFNAISTHVSYEDEHMFYLSPEKMLDYCITKLSPRVTLAHHNLPYNYTVTVFKDSDWTSLNKKGITDGS